MFDPDLALPPTALARVLLYGGGECCAQGRRPRQRGVRKTIALRGLAAGAHVRLRVDKGEFCAQQSVDVGSVVEEARWISSSSRFCPGEEERSTPRGLSSMRRSRPCSQLVALLQVAESLRRLHIPLAGKTGTVELDGPSHAWFIGSPLRRNPQARLLLPHRKWTVPERCSARCG